MYIITKHIISWLKILNCYNINYYYWSIIIIFSDKKYLSEFADIWLEENLIFFRIFFYFLFFQPEMSEFKVVVIGSGGVGMYNIDK